MKISVNTLRKATPNDVKYIIFQRVNTAGVPLTSQEMRHALNQGPAACFIKQMAELDSFVQATSHSVSSKRMEDRDLQTDSLHSILVMMNIMVSWIIF